MHGTQPLTWCLQGCYGACRGGVMQHAGYELPRIPIPRSRVNRGERRAEAVLVGRSRSYLFYLFQEVTVRLIGDARPPHRLLQLLGVGELPGVLHAVPLEEYYELVGVLGRCAVLLGMASWRPAKLRKK